MTKPRLKHINTRTIPADCITVPAMAKRVGVHQHTMRQWVADELLPSRLVTNYRVIPLTALDRARELANDRGRYRTKATAKRAKKRGAA